MPELNTGSDFKWLDGLVAKMQDTDTHPGFWVCECKEFYIHRKTDSPYCYKCNTVHSEQPDSRVSEVVKMIIADLDDCKTLTEDA